MQHAPRRRSLDPSLGGRGALLAVLLLTAPLTAQTPNVTADRTVRWGDLRFHYEVEPTGGDRVVLVATVANAGDHAVELRLPWCLAWLRLVRDGRRVWDRGEVEECAEFERVVRLRPGETERERYAVLARELPLASTSAPRLEVHAYLPAHRLPWLPPRADVDLRLGAVTLATRSTDEERAATAEFARTLSVPGLSWGASAEAVHSRLTGVGFRSAGSDPNGSLLFNGHDFLGRNAGLIARLDGGRLVKLVALMEPRASSGDVRIEFEEVLARLEDHYGRPSRVGEGPPRYALWERRTARGLYVARLTITGEGHLRLDLEPPTWQRRFLEARAASDGG